jgi:hypothetical protein
MVSLLVVLIVGFAMLLGFFARVQRDMTRGLREMGRLTREVEALLDPTALRQL